MLRREPHLLSRGQIFHLDLGSLGLADLRAHSGDFVAIVQFRALTRTDVDNDRENLAKDD